MPKVRAIKETRYAAITRMPGDVFHVASDRDAKLLVAIRKVELVPDAPAKASGANPSTAIIDDGDAAGPKRGRYARRDMTASEE